MSTDRQTIARALELASAEARVAQAKATVNEARLKLERQRSIARLSDGMFPAQAELDAALVAPKCAEAVNKLFVFSGAQGIYRDADSSHFPAGHGGI